MAIEDILIKVLDVLSHELGDVIMVVTDDTGTIQYTNQQGRELFMLKPTNTNNKNITDLLVDPEPMQKELSRGRTQWNEVFLKTPNRDKQIASLATFSLNPDDDATTQRVFIFQFLPVFNLSLNRNIYIQKIKAISRTAQILESEFGENHLLSNIKACAWDIRELFQGSFTKLIANAPKGSDKINFSELLDQTLTPVRQLNSNVLVEWENQFTGDFIAVPADLSELIQLLTDIGGLYQGARVQPTSFQLTVEEAGAIGASLTCTITGLRFGLNENGKVYFTETREYQKLTAITDKYRGFIKVIPTQDAGGVIQICLPYVKEHN